MSRRRNVHPIFAGETNKSLTVVLIDADQEPVDLTGCTVTLVYVINGEEFTREMTLTDNPGEATYQWQAEDFEDFTPGDWPMRFVRTVVSSGNEDYFPCPEDGSLQSELFDILRIRPAIA